MLCRFFGFQSCRWISASVVALIGSLTSCSDTRQPNQARTSLFGPPSSPASFIVSSDRVLGIRELARIALVIGPYRELSKSEITALERRLRRIIDDLVIEEQKQVIAELKAQRRGAPIVIEQVQRTARERVLQRLGNELALPLLTSDNRSAVAFGRVTGDAVQFTSTAFEIDTPPEHLKAESTIKKLDGSKATLLSNRRE